MRAVVVLYYWPPSGGPGVQRGVKLVRHLRDEGVEPTVVTVAPEAYELPGEYAPDPTLTAEVPPGLRVVHTPHGYRGGARAALGALRLHRAAQHVAPSHLFERQAGWLGPLTEALLTVVREVRPDVLLTSSQPWTAHLAGRAVRLAEGVPWVADFRDPWTLSWGRSWPSERALAWEERREEEVLADADAVVANTPGSRRECLERRPWLDGRKVHVVRNGYDEEDLRVAAAPRDPDSVRIVHAGSFRARVPGTEPRGLRAALRARGPEPVPYDLSTHSPLPLLRALGALGDEGRRVRVRCIGTVDPAWRAAAGESDRLELAGYLPHLRTTAEVLGADALWLPTITRRDGGPVSNVPAKTYEYLGSGRPVLAWAGPGDVADLLAGRERCRTFAPGPAGHDALVEALRDLAAGRGPPASPPDPPDARPLRRRETARGMAAALRAACRLDRAPPGADNAPPGGTA